MRAILDMARGLNLDTVVEGIETVEQLELMRDLGCRFGQGFLFAKPMDEKSVTEFVLRQQMHNANNFNQLARS